MTPLRLEQSDPGVHAQEERGPERQHHEQEEDVARPRGGPRDAVSDRIADQQTQERGDERDLDRVQEGVDVQRVGEQKRVIVEVDPDGQRILADPLDQRLVGGNRQIDVGEGDLQNDDERHDEEQQQPQVRQRHHQTAAGHAELQEWDAGVSSNQATSTHRVTTTGLDASHDRYTCCSQVIASAWREVFGWVTRTTLPEASLTR